MKRLYLLIWLIIIFVGNMYSQDSLYSIISDECGEHICKNFSSNNVAGTIKNNLNNPKELNLLIMPFKNSEDEYTEISKKISPQIAAYLSREIKSDYSRFDEINIEYAKNVNELITANYILTAQYSITNSSFFLQNINFKKPDNSGNSSIPQKRIDIDAVELTKYDYAIIADNIDQLSRALVLQYARLKGLKKVKITNFVNSNNNSPSKFSDILSDQLESDFLKKGISVKRNLTRSLNQDQTYEICGKYYKQNNRLKIISTLKDPQTNVTLATATGYIKTDYLSNNNISFQIDNQQQKQQQDDILNQDKSKNDFYLDIWTNKGSVNPVFKEGDTLKLFIETNKNCYLRIINIWSDGSKILLYDNYQITSNQLNKVFKFPYDFECSGPSFGNEKFIVYASSKSFKPLNTVDFFKDFKKINDNLDNITRSFGIIDDLKAKKSINVVTTD